jgi:hypothetical protein
MNPQAMLQLDSAGKIAAWVAAWTLAGSLPAVGWVLFARGMGRAMRVVAVVTSLLGWAWLARVEATYAHALLSFALSLCWFWLVARCVCAVAGHPSPSRSALLCGSAAACVLVPRLAAPDDAVVLVIPFGIEMMLSAYSYLVEARRDQPGPPGDAVLFMLVSPALVWTRSGMGCAIGGAGLNMRGLGRMLLGSAAMAASVMAAQSYAFVQERFLVAAELPNALQSGASMAALVAATYFAAYWGHSGAVSVRIGWMHMLGWHTPERYNYPFLARSPLDFWRRWNVHWGAWLRRYVFDELLRELRDRPRKWCGRMPVALTVVATFVASGLLHDVACYMSTFDLPLGATMGFLLCALGLLAWQALRLETRFKRSPKRRNALVSFCGGAFALLLVSILGWLRSESTLPAWLARPLGLVDLGF